MLSVCVYLKFHVSIRWHMSTGPLLLTMLALSSPHLIHGQCVHSVHHIPHSLCVLCFHYLGDLNGKSAKQHSAGDSLIQDFTGKLSCQYDSSERFGG